jgi:beta-N-acetylhexosaminidase
MTTHIIYRALDAEHPATLSQPVVTGLLRGRLGFGGLVLSDDLQMGAIIKRWGLPEAAELTLAAGCDQLLVCNMLRRDDPRQVIDHLLRRAGADPALAARAEESLERILAHKERWASRGPVPAGELATLFS